MLVGAGDVGAVRPGHRQFRGTARPARRCAERVRWLLLQPGHRLTFVVAMFSAAAAGVCVGVVVLWAVERWRHREPLRMWAVPAAFVLVVAVIAGVAVGSYHDNSFTAARQRTPKRIGPDDLAAYHWLAEQPGARGSLILNNLRSGDRLIYPVTGLTRCSCSTAPTSGPRASVRCTGAPRTSAATRTSTSWSATCTSASSSTARRATGSSRTASPNPTTGARATRSQRCGATPARVGQGIPPGQRERLQGRRRRAAGTGIGGGRGQASG